MTKTLERFQAGIETIPADVAWYLSDLGESLGKQRLFTAQAPQKLKALKEHALIESAVSSNRIEGIEVEGRRCTASRHEPYQNQGQDPSALSW